MSLSSARWPLSLTTIVITGALALIIRPWSTGITLTGMACDYGILGPPENRGHSMGDIKIEGVTHWSIPVNNLEESEKFYGELLGRPL